MRLTICVFAAVVFSAGSSAAAPILTTVDCDSTGQYTCLTRVENFQVGGELYNADFVPANIMDAFDVQGETRDELLDGFKPLKNALFWNNRDGAQAFAAGLADLLVANDVDGFLCIGRCELATADRPYGFTYVPAYLQTIYAFEIASCFAGRNVPGNGVHYCYNPGSNNQNWAVISRVPEPATLVTFGLAGLALAFLRRPSANL